MRDLINQVVRGYRSARVESQDAGSLLVRAQEAETKKPVWIQVLRGMLPGDPRIAARFRTLASAIRQLNHPNIAAVRDVGEKGGLPYVVVRALEKAQPLAARLDQPWAVDAAADVVMQAGEALEHAYKRGVVHGDLSPGSIWVAEDGRVQVTGLGVRQVLELVQAKIEQSDSPFVAPERRGGDAPAGPRADVYSLAAILYALITRRAPVIIQGSLLSAARFNAEVSAEMDLVISRALAQDPAQRYADAHDFLAALGKVAVVPAVSAAVRATTRTCARCGTRNPIGRFCTKCGAPLEEAATAAEPTGGASPPQRAQSTASGLPERAADQAAIPAAVRTGLPATGEPETVPAFVVSPLTVASGELAARFPDPPPMPEIDLDGVWARLAEQTRLAMPAPPEMPVIDWAAVAPPMPDIPAGQGG
ncbi:MAG TPA: serine/threonine-protein kinase [Anaerolineae bacterium]|nr:serine/threonine-protein kinase [Anaerolineae bacterium]